MNKGGVIGNLLLKNILNMVPEITDYNVSGKEKLDRHTREYTITVSGMCFDRKEQSTRQTIRNR